MSLTVRNYGFRFIGTPVHPDPTHIRTAAQGDAVAKTLGQCSCCLLRGHGSVVTASSIPEVFLDSLEMEENARSTVHASTLGKLLPGVETADGGPIARRRGARIEYLEQVPTFAGSLTAEQAVMQGLGAWNDAATVCPTSMLRAMTVPSTGAVIRV